jgi:hypothetical protein
MNEFERHLEKPYVPADGWIPAPPCPVETSMIEAVYGNGISTSMKRGRDFYSAVEKRDGHEIKVGKMA